MAAGNSYCMGINSNDYFIKDNKRAFTLWLNVPKVITSPYFLIVLDVFKSFQKDYGNIMVIMNIAFSRKDG